MATVRSDRRAHTAPGEDRLEFLRGFLSKPKEVGSIIPSSRFLERRIIRCAEVAEAKTVVELGPGTGGTTRALLRAMAPDARLLAIEINPRFVRHMQSQIADERLHVLEGSATEVGEILASEGLDGADVILSGIPFSTMPRALGLEILRSVRGALCPQGRFVAYQFRDRVEALGREVFGPAKIQTEIRNVPPMRVYTWERQHRSG
ncbi:MAG: methyltransferase domain-containing protein [Deltaproteobacteria bacterium]|nr:methyltransferase domain-containing protein [Deltaproteobacteria bacterium]MBW2445119.1 methyltransferase domain-containing protein [Deltaproteobacteria bacterium]